MASFTGEQLAAISREMVRINAEHLGRGPSEAKTYAFDNFVFSVLKGGLTKLEQTLARSGDESLVRQVRLRFQERKGDDLQEAVERILGRRVVAYESQVVFDPDFLFEIFVLDDVGRGLD